MKKLKVGTVVGLTDKYVKWLAETADEIHAYPHGIKNRDDNDFLVKYGLNESVQEQLSSHFMNRYSHERDLKIDGIIIGDNGWAGNKLGEQDFAYAVWLVNELGEDVCYVEPRNLEKLKTK